MLILAADDTFWTGASAIGTLLAIPTMIGLGWLAYRAVWPRRKVHWSARVRPLMSHESAHTNRLNVDWTGTRLRSPHIVEVELRNVGNKDLEPSHFHALPIEILSTAQVVALLSHSSEPSVQRVLTPTQTPTGLTLATATPLHKKQSLTYVMLVDGRDPKIGLRASVSNAKFHQVPAASLVEDGSTGLRWVTICATLATALVAVTQTITTISR
ncbi:hypothetical protein ACIP3U_32115 [[Kitasatospora] papulosa]|uniref:hypothetical protein n=1 Tax=[Kitasatospora] papulosa TaxID=1464011 RepID=UPI00380735F5